MRVFTVVGARPQFVKASVVSRALEKEGLDEVLIHTGQHYDYEMNQVFFEELEVPAPKINLGVGSSSHARQTAEMLTGIEQFLTENATSGDIVLLYGDTNSTIAGALAAAKLHIPVAHVEAGLRSFNRAMPEEINRVATDRVSNWLFCPSENAVDNLTREGVTEGVTMTGDVMFDAVLRFAGQSEVPSSVADLESFYLATIHRASNTDSRERLCDAMAILEAACDAVVWPIHPRTQSRLDHFSVTVPKNVRLISPVGYLEMLALVKKAKRVLTDSGGLQKEAFWLETPVITLRSETEWVETQSGGWNHIVDLDVSRALEALEATPTGAPAPAYGDGKASVRIAKILSSQ